MTHELTIQNVAERGLESCANSALRLYFEPEVLL